MKTNIVSTFIWLFTRLNNSNLITHRNMRMYDVILIWLTYTALLVIISDYLELDILLEVIYMYTPARLCTHLSLQSSAKCVFINSQQFPLTINTIKYTFVIFR